MSDLKTQIKKMKKKYPKHLIIKDIGSGINMEIKGLKKIIKMAVDGLIGELVVTYKDRLARFGYELIEWLIKTYSNGEIKIIHKKDEQKLMEERVIKTKIYNKINVRNS